MQIDLGQVLIAGEGSRRPFDGFTVGFDCQFLLAHQGVDQPQPGEEHAAGSGIGRGFLEKLHRLGARLGCLLPGLVPLPEPKQTAGSFQHEGFVGRIGHRRQVEFFGSQFRFVVLLVQDGRSVVGVRLDAGFHDGGRIIGRDRSVVARWEQGAVAPSLETLLDLLRACGFDLPLTLVPYEAAAHGGLREAALLSPERRIERLLRRLDEAEPRRG